MPQCFELVRKATNETVDLTELDEEICKEFNVPVHKTRWCFDWYNPIGFRIAAFREMSLGSAELRNAIAEIGIPELDKVLAYLEKNYTSNSWYESSSRQTATV